VAAPPNPQATLALLRVISPLIPRPLDFTDLQSEAKDWVESVNEFAREDEEISEYVTQLEEARDAAEMDQASGEAIAAEFEKFLREEGS
jgi:hypothetical protein